LLFIESRIRSNSGELGGSWSLLSPSKWENNNNNQQRPPPQQRLDNKSKFFDDFISTNNNNTNQFQSNRSYQRSSNTHSTQTSRENGDHYNGRYDDSGLPARQPFFSDDRPFPQRQQQHQQQNRYQNGNSRQYQQRQFHNNRRGPMSNQQRRRGGFGGGNRETFQDNPNDYDNDFDFETSNLKFNKLTSEDDFKHPTDLTSNEILRPQSETDSTTEHPVLYDKKKSFFDNLALTAAADAPPSYGYNRSKNQDTFGNNGYQRQNNRSNGGGGGGYRRQNNNYRRQQYGNEDFHYRQNNNNSNEYHYRY